MNNLLILFNITGHKKYFTFIIFISIFVSLVEFFSLMILAPYVNISISKKVPENIYLLEVLNFFNITTFNSFFIYFTSFVIIMYIIKFIMGIAFISITTKYIGHMKHIVMSKLFKHYCFIDYSHFTVKNTSDMKKTLLSEANNTQNIFKSIIDILSESFIVILLLSIIVYANWKVALVLLIFFTIVFILIIQSIKKKIVFTSKERVKYISGIHRQLDEMFNNFKFIKLTGLESIKLNLFNLNSVKLYKTNNTFAILNQYPKYIFETFGILIVVSLIFYFTIIDLDNIVETLTIYILAFYKLLPSVNKIITALNTFKYFKNTVELIDSELKIEKENYENKNLIQFTKQLQMKNISFKYSTSSTYLYDNFNVEIEKGDKVAIIGASGKGKSTLVDIIMGLLKPVQGHILVDGINVNCSNMKEWRKKFGYIPQEIYLYDASVADNVAFGRDYNQERIISVLKQARIYDYLQTKEGLETIVGEGGVQLSGGQKQRIGIARALYDNPEILVLDEATSALDDETEEKILKEVFELSSEKTLLIISHKISMLENCNKKVVL